MPQWPSACGCGRLESRESIIGRQGVEEYPKQRLWSCAFCWTQSLAAQKKAGPVGARQKHKSVPGGDKQERSASKPFNIVNGHFLENLTGDPSKDVKDGRNGLRRRFSERGARQQPCPYRHVPVGCKDRTRSDARFRGGGSQSGHHTWSIWSA